MGRGASSKGRVEYFIIFIQSGSSQYIMIIELNWKSSIEKAVKFRTKNFLIVYCTKKFSENTIGENILVLFDISLFSFIPLYSILLHSNYTNILKVLSRSYCGTT